MRVRWVETDHPSPVSRPWQSRGAHQGLLHHPAKQKEVFSELTIGFSLFKPWALLRFDPVEYPITKEELVGFQKAAMQSGVSFCFLSTWEQRHEDKDLLEMFK